MELFLSNVERGSNESVVKGSRTQFLLTLCYAITAHKAQSLTTIAAAVHCAQEFVSGQTYAALSRVKEEAALQVIGFQQKVLLPVPIELLSLADDQCDPDPTLCCCRNIHLDESFFQSSEDDESDGMSIFALADKMISVGLHNFNQITFQHQLKGHTIYGNINSN